jgi:Ca2+-binding EF-hand superfamily protein
MDIRTKDEFVFFMQRACEDTSNDCYIELYNILLRAFITADKDFDGQVSEDEFEGMIKAAASFPQKFGFEWWAGSGKDQFAAIDENGDGSVSFDEWLGFSYNHYKSQKLELAFDQQDRDAFVKDCKSAADTASESYKKIYWFSWKCFQAADADRDGQVSNSEFAAMINVATNAQKRLGLPAPYQTAEERDGLFKAMDENGDGSISYDEWLSCFMKEIVAPVAAL